MAKPKKNQASPSRARTVTEGVSRPISFRLGRPLIEQLDAVAGRLAVTRNNLVAIVLTKYLSDRGDEVETLVKTEAASARSIDLFA